MVSSSDWPGVFADSAKPSWKQIISKMQVLIILKDWW